jgi:hypothetical protein
VDGVHIWTDSESLRRTALVYGGDSSKDSGPAIVLGALRLAPRSSGSAPGSSVWVLKGAGPVRAGKFFGRKAFRTRGRTLKVEKLDDAGRARRVVTGVRVGPRTSVSGQHVRERQSVVGPNGCEVPLDVSAAIRRRHRRGRVVARGPRLGGLLGGRGPRGRIGVDAGALDEHRARAAQAPAVASESPPRIARRALAFFCIPAERPDVPKTLPPPDLTPPKCASPRDEAPRFEPTGAEFGSARCWLWALEKRSKLVRFRIGSTRRARPCEPWTRAGRDGPERVTIRRTLRLQRAPKLG